MKKNFKFSIEGDAVKQWEWLKKELDISDESLLKSSFKLIYHLTKETDKGKSFYLYRSDIYRFLLEEKE